MLTAYYLLPTVLCATATVAVRTKFIQSASVGLYVSGSTQDVVQRADLSSSIYCGTGCGMTDGCVGFVFDDKCQLLMETASKPLRSWNDDCGLSEEGLQGARKIGNHTWTPPSGWTGPHPALYAPLDYIPAGYRRGVLSLTGKVKNCAHIMGSYSYVFLGDYSLDEPGICWPAPSECPNGVTIMFWFKRHTSSTLTDVYLMSTDCSPERCKSFYMYMRNQNLIVKNMDSNLNTDTATNPFPLTERWYHVTVTMTTGSKIYVNGASVSTTSESSSIGTVTRPERSLLLGQFSNGRLDNQNDRLYFDDLIIWQKALSADEILALYKTYNTE